MPVADLRIARIVSSSPVAVGSNLVYTIEYKDALSDLAWNRLKTLTGDGGTVTIIEPPTNGTSRFYRLRID